MGDLNVIGVECIGRYVGRNIEITVVGRFQAVAMDHWLEILVMGVA